MGSYIWSDTRTDVGEELVRRDAPIISGLVREGRGEGHRERSVGGRGSVAGARRDGRIIV